MRDPVHILMNLVGTQVTLHCTGNRFMQFEHFSITVSISTRLAGGRPETNLTRPMGAILMLKGDVNGCDVALSSVGQKKVNLD